MHHCRRNIPITLVDRCGTRGSFSLEIAGRCRSEEHPPTKINRLRTKEAHRSARGCTEFQNQLTHASRRYSHRASHEGCSRSGVLSVKSQRPRNDWAVGQKNPRWRNTSSQKRSGSTPSTRTRFAEQSHVYDLRSTKYPAPTKHGDHNKNFESATSEIKIKEAGFLKKSPEFAGALAPCRLSRGRPLSGRRVQDTRLRLLGRPRYLPVPVRTSGAARAESAAL